MSSAMTLLLVLCFEGVYCTVLYCTPLLCSAYYTVHLKRYCVSVLHYHLFCVMFKLYVVGLGHTNTGFQTTPLPVPKQICPAPHAVRLKFRLNGKCERAALISRRCGVFHAWAGASSRSNVLFCFSYMQGTPSILGGLIMKYRVNI